MPCHGRSSVGKVLAGLAVVLALIAANKVSAPTAEPVGMDLASLVDPLTGTAGGGDTFPGATTPFGMVQVSPDTGFSQGYSYAGTAIRGFSQVHLSGAGSGCAHPAFGDVPLMPTVGAVSTTSPAANASGFSHTSEVASPGYYAVDLDRYGVRAELTATTRTGWQRYTFPPTDQANVLVDVGAADNDVVDDAAVRIVGDDTIEGWVRASACGSMRQTYTVYFSAQFTRAFTGFGTWAGNVITAGSRGVHDQRAGAYLRFDTTAARTVEARVGVSFTSVAGARLNRKHETNGTSFDAARAAAHERWNALLHRIEISGGTDEQRATFYTALYHALLGPNVFSDVDGRYLGFDGRLHVAVGRAQYADWSLWDTYRSEMPLLGLVVPDRVRDMAASLLADADDGWLPKWSVANGESNVMTGDPVTPVFADADSKGLLTGMQDEAFAALWRNATQAPPADSPYEGRWGVRNYLRHGYVPYDPGAPQKGGSDDTTTGASITLEYALSDAVLAGMARRLGHQEQAGELLQRGSNYRAVFDAASTYFRPRRRDGSWVRPFNPTGATDGFSEASAAQYQWLVPQDPAGLFKLLGGEQAALTRLDGFFDYPGLLMDQDATTHTVWCPPPNGMCPSAHYNPNNEPDLHAPFLYLWTRQPYKTATVVRAAQDLYHTGPDGLPGNDDLGTMSAWYVFASLGIYPVLPGSGAYELTSPLFPHAVVRLPGPYYHGELVIDAPGASDARRYITAASLDGRSFDRDWIGQATVTAGATIHYDVADRQPGDDATTWGGAPQARPPELLTGDAGPSR